MSPGAPTTLRRISGRVKLPCPAWRYGARCLHSCSLRIVSSAYAGPCVLERPTLASVRDPASARSSTPGRRYSRADLSFRKRRPRVVGPEHLRPSPTRATDTTTSCRPRRCTASTLLGPSRCNGGSWLDCRRTEPLGPSRRTVTSRPARTVSSTMHCFWKSGRRETSVPRPTHSSTGAGERARPPSHSPEAGVWQPSNWSLSAPTTA